MTCHLQHDLAHSQPRFNQSLKFPGMALRASKTYFGLRHSMLSRNTCCQMVQNTLALLSTLSQQFMSHGDNTRIPRR
jgi:hypothetical protein